MKKILILKSKYLVCFIIFPMFFSCEKTKEDELFSYLTNDSISMWNVTMSSLAVLSDSTYYHHYFRSISFDENFECNQYAYTIYGDRMIDFLGPEPNYLGLCNQWGILNDSTVKLNCRDVFVVRIISRDTVHLIDTLGVKQHEMYRVQPPWNIDEELVKMRDKEVKSGKYLENNLDGEMFRDAPIGNRRLPQMY